MTNLAGHDIASVLEAFRAVNDDRPTCFIAYTIKGYGLPFAGHKDNHAGLMSREQMTVFQRAMGVPEGEEWEPFAGLGAPSRSAAQRSSTVCRSCRAAHGFTRARRCLFPRRSRCRGVAAPPRRRASGASSASWRAQRRRLAARIVTTSPDVTVSTNLGGWVNRRGIFDRRERADVFREHDVLSPQHWSMSPPGQHFELGIAEHNLFLMLGALGWPARCSACARCRSARSTIPLSSAASTP